MAFHTDDVRRLCLKWDEGLDPDGVAPDDEERQSRRFLSVGAIKDGMARVNGMVTAEVAAALGAIVDAVSNPRAKAGAAVLGAEGPPATGALFEGGGFFEGDDRFEEGDHSEEGALDGISPLGKAPGSANAPEVCPTVVQPAPDPTDNRTPASSATIQRFPSTAT